VTTVGIAAGAGEKTMMTGAAGVTETTMTIVAHGPAGGAMKWVEDGGIEVTRTVGLGAGRKRMTIVANGGAVGGMTTAAGGTAGAVTPTVATYRIATTMMMTMMTMTMTTDDRRGRRATGDDTGPRDLVRLENVETQPAYDCLRGYSPPVAVNCSTSATADRTRPICDSTHAHALHGSSYSGDIALCTLPCKIAWRNGGA
jgi:hypothetical protein